MTLRRERTHHSGSSNLTYSSQREFAKTPDGVKSITFSTLMKGQKASDIVEKKKARGLISPITTTQEMYKSTGKFFKSRTEVGYPRLAQLEEVEKRKLCFTGESTLIFDKKLEKYRDLDIEVDHIHADLLIKKENLVKEKHKLHGTAIQETQLVGYDKYSADTLKNNVDLEKVREAKRVLRRRYVTRKNFFTIYNAWDVKHTGHIAVEDVYSMSKNLGLNLNFDEARVLLASADKSGVGVLNMDDFLDLIYNKDDVLNVDLDKLATTMDHNYLIRREELESDRGNIIKKLEADAKRAREARHMNKINLVLKNHIHHIAGSFVEADPTKLGYVNYEKFEESLKKLGINENIVSTKDIKELFDKHKSETHTINYRNFVDTLKNFHFQHDEAYKEQEIHSPQKESNNTMPKPTETFHIVDCRNLPYHTMVNYLGKTRKVNRAIKRFFPQKEDFYKYLGDSLRLEKENVPDRYVNQKELKGLIDGLFGNFDQVEVVKRDFEAFLSTCIYNDQGDTNLKEVARMVYDEEEREYFYKINFKKKGPGPRKDVAEPVDPNVEATKSYRESLESESQGLARSASVTKMRTQSKGSENVDNLLQKIDNTFFVGTRKAYDTFKFFDTDKDGYVSRKDLFKTIEDRAIMSREDIQAVLDYVDPEKKGFVNFQEFSNKVRPNMVYQDENAEFKSLPFISPSKEAFLKTAETIPKTKEKVKSLIALCQPEFSDKAAKTRFGASPSWTNTFLNFQVGTKSPMFISEGERFDRSVNAGLKFQLDASEKRKGVDEARLKMKQMNQFIINERIEKQATTLSNLEESIRNKKYMLQSRYEQRAKLFNEYV